MSTKPRHERSEKYCRRFLQGEDVVIPDDQKQLRSAVIAEATRLALASELQHASDDHPRVHVLSLRSWVVNKLAALLGEPDTDGDDPDWFRDVLTDGRGPTLTFLGEVLELAQGYYAPAPTRAVMINSSEAILISPTPTHDFTDQGLTIDHRGVPRQIVNSSAEAIRDAGIPIQSRESYVGLDSIKTFDKDLFKSWQTRADFSKWNVSAGWEAYYPKDYGFGWGDSGAVVPVDGQLWSLFCDTTEYGSRDYWWKIQGHEEASGTVKVHIPNMYWKQFALFLDAASGEERAIRVVKTNDSEVAIQCPFAPPAAQVRWLHAIGAEFDRFVDHGLQWRFSSDHLDATKDVFSGLAVSIVDKRQEENK